MAIDQLPAPNRTKPPERIDGIQAVTDYPDHLARYRFALQWAPNSRVLDVCCGVGYGSFLLAAGGAAAVLGVDIAESAIESARRQPALPNLKFEVADACTHLPSPGSWNLITCFEGIEHVPQPARLLASIYQALRPGGIALVSTPNADAYGGHSGNPYHLSEMPESEFRRYVGAHDWQTKWYGQAENESLWRRPRWMRALIRRLPRSIRPTSPRRSNWTGEPASATALTTLEQAEDWYPRPWDQLAELLYTPPAPLMLAVCRKPLRDA